MYSVRPADITYLLPGGGGGSDELAAVERGAVAAAADPTLLELAWEMSEADALYR